jgi:chromate transporter
VRDPDGPVNGGDGMMEQQTPDSFTPSGSASPNGWIEDDRVPRPAPPALRPIGLARIGFVFLRIGTAPYRGLGPTLGVIERDLVEERGALRPGDVVHAVAAAKLLPGSALTQVVSFLGYRLGGWRGSMVATVAFLAPSLAAMVVLGLLYDVTAVAPLFMPAARGLKAGVVGLVLATLCRFGQTMIQGPRTLALALAAFGLSAGLGVPATAIVIIAGPVGVLLFAHREAGVRHGRKRGTRP